MLLTRFLPLILLGACVTHGPPLRAQPSIGIDYSDLALETPAGRAVLRQRVAAAAQSYCTEHGSEMTPAASRYDPYYCPDMMRSAFMAKMPREVRRAYSLARREAGVSGRRL
ncbi:UrcA family protein [Sphingomonas sp. DT-207]|uniref:UrcA family protein n=1 Tax=Sphingomonas sp. DT-207 TaxID=3396167 RepID=UPI003F1B46CE